MSVLWGETTMPAPPKSELAICERCGRVYVRGRHTVVPFCPSCTGYLSQGQPRVTKPVAPALYDKLDIAQYRPAGTHDEVWARIEDEAKGAQR